MRRADRLFQIIQIMRRSSRPVTASQLAEELEVSKRSVYRDIADLMAQRVPIEGAAGLGYVLDRDFDMPPLMLTPDELEAAVLGAQWVADKGDAVLAARRARPDRQDIGGRARTSAPLHRQSRPSARPWARRRAGGPRRTASMSRAPAVDPQRPQDPHKLPRRPGQGERADDLAGDHRLCRNRPAARRLVRAALDLPAFPDGSHHRRRIPRRTPRPPARRSQGAMDAPFRGRARRQPVLTDAGRLPNGRATPTDDVTGSCRRGAGRRR